MLISTSTPSYSTASLLSSQVSSDPDRRLKISPFCLSRSNDFAELDRAGSMPRPAAAEPAPRLSTNLSSYTVSRFVLKPPQPLTDLTLRSAQVAVATPSLFFSPARPTSGFSYRHGARRPRKDPTDQLVGMQRMDEIRDQSPEGRRSNGTRHRTLTDQEGRNKRESHSR